MTNKEAVEFFEGYTHGARVEKLFWIAASFETGDLKDLFNEIPSADLRRMFPALGKSQHFDQYAKDRQVLWGVMEFRNYGLIAEVHYPTCDNFSFDEKGNYTSCSVRSGVCRVGYAYGETMEDLAKDIQKVGEVLFQEFIEQDKNKKLNKSLSHK